MIYMKQRRSAQYEFIPWILGSCASVGEARVALDRMTLTGTPFSEQLPTAQLHWIIADRNGAITVECMADGLHVYENPVGVLTNNPPFPQQMFLLNQYMGLSPKQPVNTFAPEVGLSAYSRGMGAIGLPGDLSSTSRFARVAFVKQNSLPADSEAESVSQFFHILGSVDQQRGCRKCYPEVCPELIFHGTPLTITCCYGRIRYERQVISEHRTAHDGRHTERQIKS